MDYGLLDRSAGENGPFFVVGLFLISCVLSLRLEKRSVLIDLPLKSLLWIISSFLNLVSSLGDIDRPR